MSKVGYVDFFLLTIPKKKLAWYKSQTRIFARMMKKYGGLAYVEATGDDIGASDYANSFTKAIKVPPGHYIVASYVSFKSRKHRDEVNKKMMTDPEMQKSMQTMTKEGKAIMKTMRYGGFRAIMAQ